MRRVVHLVPYDGIGGVEAAARTMLDVREPDLTYQVRWLFPDVGSRAQRRATNNPLRLLSAALAIAREAPDLLVVSLWRCVIVGLLVRLLNRRIGLAVFIHNSDDAHPLDRFFTRLAVKACDAVWTDSAASVAARLPTPPRAPVTVISYLSQHLAPLPAAPAGEPVAPVFGFWGRLSVQKNVARALDIFGRVHAARPDARFLIIGPDGGEEAMLRARVRESGLDEAVTFAGPLDFAAVQTALSDAGARFCLQTSRYEGMALSVTEAMQLGLVPVVTPVGEIGRYCVDGDNAVLVGDSDAAAAGRVLALIADRDAYDALRGRALEAWRDTPLYRDSVLAAARSVVASR